MRPASPLLALLVVLALAGPALAAELAYSFRAAGKGGVASLSVDEASGAVASHRVLFEDGRAALAKKARFSSDGSSILLTLESEDKPYACLVSADQPAQALNVDLPEPCDEARAAGGAFVVTCDKGRLALVDARTGNVTRVWEGREELKPAAADPEDVAIASLPEGHRVVVSFQKDKKDGKYRGHRIAVLELPSMETLADLALPRDRESLHLPGNSGLQGPCPEVVIPVPSSNALLVTLDLYGAVALMDLNAALEGKLAGYSVLPTDPGGSWGNSFPDRAARMPGPNGADRVLVTNAGRAGGAVLVEPASRSLVARWVTPPGLETPEWVAPLKAAVAVCTGKTKFRGATAVEQETHPRTELYLLPAGPGASSKMPVKTFDLKAPTRALAAVHPASSRFVMVALEAAGDDRLAVVDGATGQVVSELTAAGQVQRFERRP